MRADSRGFTLVEMMIALVVLSLISLGTVTAMRTLGMTQERLSATTERVDELRQVSQFLRNSLRQAVVPPQSGFGGTWAEPVAGLALAEDDELIWLAPFDTAGGMGGLIYFRLYRDGSDLRVQLQPHRDTFDHASWTTLAAGEVLVSGLEDLQIGYRHATGEAWQAAIADDDLSNYLPEAIRIVIRADGRFWPDIIVSPELGGR